MEDIKIQLQMSGGEINELTEVLSAAAHMGAIIDVEGRLSLSNEAARNILTALCRFYKESKKGNIALVLLRLKAKKDGVQIAPETFKREAGNIAAAAGLDVEDVMTFLKEEYATLVRNL